MDTTNIIDIDKIVEDDYQRKENLYYLTLNHIQDTIIYCLEHGQLENTKIPMFIDDKKHLKHYSEEDRKWVFNEIDNLIKAGEFNIEGVESVTGNNQLIVQAYEHFKDVYYILYEIKNKASVI